MSSLTTNVEDSFLHRLHDRGVEVVHPAPWDEGEGAELVLTVRADRADGKCAGQTRHVSGGEGEKDVAGEMAARRSSSGQTERDPARQRLALSRQQGSVGGHDGDDGASAGGWLDPEVDFEPVALKGIVVGQRGSDMPSRDG